MSELQPFAHTDHDLLIRLNVLAERTGQDVASISERLTGFDTRIRQLENFRYWILGAAAAAGAVASQIAQRILPVGR